MYIYANTIFSVSENENCFKKVVEKKSKDTFHVPYLSVQQLCYLWDNVEKYGTDRQDKDDKIIQRMHCIWWVTKATDTRSKYVIIIASPWQQQLCKCVSMLCL